jgi:osmotically-inducible protein OsmY
VAGGEVTLRGNVDSRYEKRATEDIAESVQGVRQVHNELRVHDGQPPVTPNVTK